MQKTAIAMISMLLFLGGSIWVQIFLSKKRNKWFGLIIPIICFMLSIMGVFSLSILSLSVNNNTGNASTGIISVTETIDGIAVTDNTIALPSMISILVTVIPTFLIFNIPTIIFLAIYFACREKLKLRNELNKMNVQDLE